MTSFEDYLTGTFPARGTHALSKEIDSRPGLGASRLFSITSLAVPHWQGRAREVQQERAGDSVANSCEISGDPGNPCPDLSSEMDPFFKQSSWHRVLNRSVGRGVFLQFQTSP